ncbi:MAG: SMI1/KNR4 family protein [Spirochaetales bacterium]|nr:SMI1/KNR4 family protein [Spirochaetales bacterium]
MIIKWSYITKTTADKIKNAQTKYGVTLPKDVIKCILENNGGYPSRPYFDTAETKDCVFEKLLSYNEEDADNVYVVADYFRENNQRLYPIASDPFGNYICISDDGIVLYRHESNDTEYICQTFSDLLKKLKQ